MIPSLSDDEIEDRYFLLGRMEIINVLNELIYRRELVTVYFSGGRDVLVTTLLEARPEALIFDLSGDVSANNRIHSSPTCVFVARMNGIRVQFSCSQVNRFMWGGGEAFWAPLPEKIVRLQRRESYRILLPIAKPLMVKLYGEGHAVLGEWPAHDLSVGGLGFNAIGEPPLTPGQIVSRLHLPLMKQKHITCAAVVRHVTQIAEKFEGAQFRVGLSFDNLPGAMGVTIQRHIIKIELERRGLPGRFSDDL
ncbi:MAG: flagellar brake protein [Burkholderiales bacterium]|nr:flagellar brake protein [Burkholderiales bacterium]